MQSTHSCLALFVVAATALVTHVLVMLNKMSNEMLIKCQMVCVSRIDFIYLHCVSACRVTSDDYIIYDYLPLLFIHTTHNSQQCFIIIREEENHIFQYL